jgi:hypothetical protein
VLNLIPGHLSNVVERKFEFVLDSCCCWFFFFFFFLMGDWGFANLSIAVILRIINCTDI